MEISDKIQRLVNQMNTQVIETVKDQIELEAAKRAEKLTEEYENEAQQQAETIQMLNTANMAKADTIKLQEEMLSTARPLVDTVKRLLRANPATDAYFSPELCELIVRTLAVGCLDRLRDNLTHAMPVEILLQYLTARGWNIQDANHCHDRAGNGGVLDAATATNMQIERDIPLEFASQLFPILLVERADGGTTEEAE